MSHMIVRTQESSKEFSTSKEEMQELLLWVEVLNASKSTLPLLKSHSFWNEKSIKREELLLQKVINTLEQKRFRTSQ